MTHFVATFPLRFTLSESVSRKELSLNSFERAGVILFSLAVDENGGLAATAFGQNAELSQRAQLDKTVEDVRRTAPFREQIEAFFAGELHTFSLPLAPRGSPFQHRVWAELQRIPYGETRSYGDLARQLGSAPRAVGRANATNPICLIIPCHRVIGTDGSLTGFAFGQEIKRQLLDHETHFRSASSSGKRERAAV